MRNETDSSSNTPVDWETFEAYLAGELRQDPQSDHVRRLLDQLSGAERILKSQGLFEHESNPSTPIASTNYVSVAASWDALKSKIVTENLADRPEATVTPPPKAKFPHKPFSEHVSATGRFKFGVRLAAVAGLIMFAWLAGAGKVRDHLSTYASVYSTQAGRQASLTLPDGTEVLLNVGSRLEVSGDFFTANRKVKLVGQAKFNVKHQTGNPFLVETSAGTVTVLGTEFVVRDYEWDTLKTVSVWSGRVGVGTDVVAAGEQLSVVADRGVVRSAVKAALDTTSGAFAEGVFIVNDKRLEDIIPELSAWYAVDIKFGDSAVKSRRISGRFQFGAVSELIEVLAWTLDVRSERSGDQITLYSK